MFPLLLRVLTIAGTFAVAAVITRRYMSHKEAENSYDAGNGGQSHSDSGGSSHVVSETSRRGSKSPAQGEANSSDRVSVCHHDPGEATGPAVSVEAASMANSTSLEKIPADGPHGDLAQAEASEGNEPHAEKIHVEASPAKAAEADAPHIEIHHHTNSSFAPETVSNPAEERARIVLDSSKQILTNYKQPDGLKVDLGLAHFSLDTAERLMAQSKYDEALEKASAVGLLVGMSEMRAAVENQLKTLASDGANGEKIKAIRAILSEGDLQLAEASKSFVMEEAGDAGAFMNHLQLAFQKTTQAQSELTKIVA
jgi:hypothetical protein